MHFHIDPQNGIPIYEQVVRQVKFAVANAVLQVGEHVPSVRDMAGRLAVNPNTVARAYRDLQSGGILLPIRGTGLAVSPAAPERCRAERLEMIRERLRSILSEALRNQITSEEVRGLVNTELARIEAENPTPSAATA